MTNSLDQRTIKRSASTRAYALVLLLVILVILYGSLFPFTFNARAYPGGPLCYLLHTWRVWDHRGDLIANILLYLPFGFFAAKALPPRFPASAKFIAVLLAGVVLSVGVETAQFHDAGRVTSMGDVYANAIGTGLGALTGVLLDTSSRWPLVGELVLNPAEALLLSMFFAYRFFPYVPVIDLHKYWHAVRTMLLNPSLPSDELMRYFITWLFVASLVHVLFGPRRFLFIFALLCAAEFIGKILIIGNELKLTDLVGAAAAWLVWALVLRRFLGRFAFVAFLFAAMIVMERLGPFRFASLPRAFGWIPFVSFMHGSIAVDIQAFCQKFYEYGGLIWLLNRSGIRSYGSTLSTAALLLATSFAERWLPGRSAEITNAVMALIIGAGFALLQTSDASLSVQTSAADGGKIDPRLASGRHSE